MNFMTSEMWKAVLTTMLECSVRLKHEIIIDENVVLGGDVCMNK
jgi:hypothetical protein